MKYYQETYNFIKHTQIVSGSTRINVEYKFYQQNMVLELHTIHTTWLHAIISGMQCFI